MAEMTLRLQIDPETGKKNILVSLKGDEDALPHEHEQMHRQLVDKLIEGGLLKAGEEGDLIIEREEETGAAESPKSAPQEERSAQSEGN